MGRGGMAWPMAAVFIGAQAAGAAGLREQIESYVEAHQKEIVAELVELLSIPNVASDRENVQRKAERLHQMLAERGFETELLPTEGNPLVHGELSFPGAERTLLLYAHYDGQPVDPAQWHQPDPFTPVLRDGRWSQSSQTLDFSAIDRFDPDWRIYARSASDDTSPIVAMMAALDALRAAGVRPSSNLRIILDGEEEAGSPSLVPAIERYRDKLRADMMLILDGPAHPSGRPTLVFGARGILTLQLTVYGPRFPLHSGHYGNWIPNPAMRLAQLLASMKDDAGRATIEGFYDGIELTGEERAILDSVPDDHQALLDLFGVAEADRIGRSLQEALQYPSLNVRGLRSAWVGAETRTIIPSHAVAELDVRLVRETDADRMYEKVIAHLRKQGYHVVGEEPDAAVRARHGRIVKVTRGAGTNAYRTALDDPHAQTLVAALAEIWGEQPVVLRTSGGTLPIAAFIEALGFPAVSVPIVNFDNNQHSPDENLRLGHFFRGIVTLGAIYTQ